MHLALRVRHDIEEIVLENKIKRVTKIDLSQNEWTFGF